MKVFKAIIHILAWISYVAIAVYAIICIPIIFGHKPLVVLSDSMEPHIKEGSIIYFKKVPKKEIKEGNVISFKVSDKIFSHIVYKVEEKGFTTKGDATSTIDPVIITYDQVLGKVDSIAIPYIGYYVKLINTHYYIVIIVVAILIVEFVLGNISRKKEELITESETETVVQQEDTPSQPETTEEVKIEQVQDDKTLNDIIKENTIKIENAPQEEPSITQSTEEKSLSEIIAQNTVQIESIPQQRPSLEPEPTPTIEPIIEEKKYKTEVFNLDEIKEASKESSNTEEEEIEIL